MRSSTSWFSLTTMVVGMFACSSCNRGPNAAAPTAGNQATQAGESGNLSEQHSDAADEPANAAKAASAATAPSTQGGRSGQSSASAAGSSAARAGSTATSAGTGSASVAQTSAGASAGAAGQAGQTAQAAGAGFQCPAGPFAEPIPAGASVTRVENLPPLDAFNADGNTRTNVEGPVWASGKLYVSEFAFAPAPDSRILALDPLSGAVSVALASAGSNGLAVDMSGALLVTDHKQGAIVRMGFPLGSGEVITATFEGKRFNSPNDLAMRSDGTLYFSDPDYQAPSMKPQPKTRVYRLAPGALEPVVIDDTRSQPNGVTLAADERTLYVAGADGIFSYPVTPDGSVAPGSGMRLNAFNGGADGLGMDCAGNLYATSGQRIVVLSAQGAEIASLPVSGAESVTNVAFGGAEHQTLFITSMGSGNQRGVFRVELNVPGFPY